MRIETTTRLLKAFNSCPSCGEKLMMNGFKVDNDSFELKCWECGWRINGKES